MQVTYEFGCRIEIGIPMRCAALGKITSNRASLWTAEVANIVAPLLCESRDPDDWVGAGEMFCEELRTRMKRLMNSKHQGLGATVSKHHP
jgi:hypothetical protein